MTLKDIKELLHATVLTDNNDLDRVIQYAYSTDMMSDVLAYAKHDSILITGLCNPQVIRTAEMMDLAGIIFIMEKIPDDIMVSLAKEIDLCLMVTNLTMFTICGKLFHAGLDGGV